MGSVEIRNVQEFYCNYMTADSQQLNFMLFCCSIVKPLAGIALHASTITIKVPMHCETGTNH